LNDIELLEADMHEQMIKRDREVIIFEDMSEAYW
jgi:hypothetical protein